MSARSVKKQPAAKASGAGYSGTPLAVKLGLDAGRTVLLMNEPSNYAKLIGSTFAALKKVNALGKSVDVVHLFTTTRSGLTDRLQRCRRDLRDDAVVWVSWPKKSSGVPTDVTEQTIRDVALPMGFVDIKVCAVDDTWSGLKLMVRKDLRRQ